MIRTENIRHDVAAEGRTGPDHEPGFRIDGESGAVGAKACTGPGRNAGTEITAIIGRSDQNGSRFEFFDQIAKCHSVCFGVIVFILGAFHQIDLVGAAGEQLSRHSFHLITDQYSGQFFTEFVSQLAAFTQEFMGNALDLTFRLFNEHPNAFILGFVHCYGALDFFPVNSLYRTYGDTGAAHGTLFSDIGFAFLHYDRIERASRNTGSATNAFILINDYSHFIVPPCLRLFWRR